MNQTLSNGYRQDTLPSRNQFLHSSTVFLRRNRSFDFMCCLLPQSSRPETKTFAWFSVVLRDAGNQAYDAGSPSFAWAENQERRWFSLDRFSREPDQMRTRYTGCHAHFRLTTRGEKGEQSLTFRLRIVRRKRWNYFGFRVAETCFWNVGYGWKGCFYFCVWFYCGDGCCVLHDDHMIVYRPGVWKITELVWIARPGPARCYRRNIKKYRND